MAKTSLTHWTLPNPPDKLEHNRWVNLMSDPADYHVVLLASMGMSYALISAQVGLSIGQVAYRVHRANRGRKDWEKINAYNYRNGISDISREVIKLSANKVARMLNPELRKSLAVIEV